MTAQLRQLVGSLEERVTERTQAVQRRAVQLQVTAEVARDAATIQDPEQLLSNIARLISERFGFYHVGIFLLGGRGDESRPIGAAGSQAPQAAFAVLRAASSDGGQRMLARHHRLRVGAQGIVGYVAASGQPRIALDVGSDAIFFNNPDLPATRSEMALPLKVGAGDLQGGAARVIGVLDVQSTEASAFAAEDVEILQILADQIAVAIENARLLSESQESLRQLERVYGERVRQSWKERIRSARQRGPSASGTGGEAEAETGESISYHFDSNRLQTVHSGEQAAGAATSGDGPEPYRVEAPIELRGQALGKLVLQRPRPWTHQEVELVQEAIAQVALAVENARLLEEIQQRAFQEELINQIVSRTQTSLDLQTIMKTLVQELSQAVGAEKIRIRLGESTRLDDAAAPPNGNGGQA